MSLSTNKGRYERMLQRRSGSFLRDRPLQQSALQCRIPVYSTILLTSTKWSFTFSPTNGDMRSHLYCLFPKRNDKSAILEVISRASFYKQCAGAEKSAIRFSLMLHPRNKRYFRYSILVTCQTNSPASVFTTASSPTSFFISARAIGESIEM